MDYIDRTNILVVGAGVMGHSIAQVFASAGFPVALADTKPEILDRAMGHIESNLNTMADFGKLERDAIGAILSRITPTVDLVSASGRAGFIIEAVPEVAEIKKKVLSNLEASCCDDTVIASNTSGLDIFSISEINRPERLVIAHFFSPPHIIPLVEVVPGPRTKPEAVSLTTALLQRAGKEPVVLNGFVPSFIVNRIQNAIGTAVVEMLENGWAKPEDIDRAVKLSLGIRLPVVGVVQTADFNGLDLVSDIFKSIGKDSAFFDKLVSQGRLGVKTSKGIYDYGDRSESEILKKRDGLFFRLMDFLKEIQAYEPV